MWLLSLYHQICSVRILSTGILATISPVKKNLVGPRVRQARRDAEPKVTQLELVARLQVLGLSIDQSGLSKIENGCRPVTDIEVALLAKALKVSVDWLFSNTEVLPAESRGNSLELPK